MNEITNRFTERFYSWVSLYGPRLVIAIVILFIGMWLINMLMKAVSKFLANRKLPATIKPFLSNLLKFILQLILLFVILQLLGVKMTLFATVIGALGVAAGLALSGTLQNFTSGVLIILLRPFKIGDNIKTQGEEGTVRSIRLFYTTIVTFSNTTLIVPNGKLSNEVIFNLTLNNTRRYDISLKTGLENDFQQIKKNILAVISSSNDILKEPAARIGITDISADSYNIGINIWLNAHGFEDSKLRINELLLGELKNLKKKPA
ncbi:MAG: mechanosensitive ion channel [Ferruginibacter sp.]